MNRKWMQSLTQFGHMVAVSGSLTWRVTDDNGRPWSSDTFQINGRRHHVPDEWFLRLMKALAVSYFLWTETTLIPEYFWLGLEAFGLLLSFLIKMTVLVGQLVYWTVIYTCLIPARDIKASFKHFSMDFNFWTLGLDAMISPLTGSKKRPKRKKARKSKRR